jgi:hypothetical protein
MHKTAVFGFRCQLEDATKSGVEFLDQRSIRITPVSIAAIDFTDYSLFTQWPRFRVGYLLAFLAQ